MAIDQTVAYGPARSIWPTTPAPNSFLVYCVDYDGLALPGNDASAQPGYALSTGVAATDRATALAAAVRTPFKTLERVGQLLPRNINNATVVVLAKPRTAGATYRNIANTADQDMDWFNALASMKAALFRATTDFTNTAAEQVECGFQITGATNAGGYNAIGGSTTTSLVSQLNGGGAAGFPAETNGYSTITGKRLRFLPTTTTVALRNIARMVYSNTAGALVVALALPVVPATTDVYVLEEPGLRVGFGGFTGESPDHSINPITIAGVRFTGASPIWSGPMALRIAGCESASTVRPSDILRYVSNGSYTNELGATVTPGVGLRSDTHADYTTITTLQVGSCCTVSGGDTIGACRTVNYGAGCVIPSVIATGPANAATTAISAAWTMGNNASTSSMPLRMNSPGTPAGLGAIVLRQGAGASIRGVTFGGFAGPLVTIDSIGGNFQLNDLADAGTANTDVILDVQTGRSCEIAVALLGANTTTATTGEVRFPGNFVSPTALTLLSSTDLWDENRNHIAGAGRSTINPGTKNWNNDSGATIPVCRLIRITATGLHATAAFADTAAHARAVGVSLTPAANGSDFIAGHSGALWVEFQSGPTVGAPAYVSDVTAGMATSTAPAVPRAFGAVIAVNGSLGLVNFTPVIL